MKKSKFITSWLLQSILATIIFCFFPVGIVGVVYALISIAKMGKNDEEGATKAANEAKKWSIIAFGIGAGLLVVLFWYGIFKNRLGC